MDERGIPRKDILALLEKAYSKDLKYSDGMVLGSMCTTPHVFAKEVYSMFMNVNLGDAGLFRGTKEVEEKVITSLRDLLGLKTAYGHVVTGGTEANILALWAARNASNKKRVIVPETAHFSLEKAANLLGLEIVKAAVDDEKRVDVGDLESKIDNNTCAIVGVAGTTEYGTVDDLSALSKVSWEKNVYLHVDAAFGGFVLPFLPELGYPVSFDINAEGINSVTLDPHKMGLVPIPCGCIIFKDKRTLKHIGTESPYLTQKTQYTVVGTRTGASSAAAYAVFKLLGRAGYREKVKDCMENTMRLYKGISDIGYAVRKPTMNILTFRGHSNTYKALSKKGWQLSKTRDGEIRIIVMSHVDKKVVTSLLTDLKSVLGR
jgi:tyrosine decarboxylase/aspartate 1-decarboxylase